MKRQLSYVTPQIQLAEIRKIYDRILYSQDSAEMMGTCFIINAIRLAELLHELDQFISERGNLPPQWTSPHKRP